MTIPTTPRVTSVGNLRDQKRFALRAAFVLLLALLVISTFEAYRIQRASSAETLEIYHRHLKQDNAVYGLRRTLWLGGHAARDFLLNPFPDRIEHFERLQHEYRERSAALLNELETLASHGRDQHDLRSKTEEFWTLLASIPRVTESLTPEERYEFVQREIAARRSAVGDTLREVAQVNQQALHDAESGFLATRQNSARRLQQVLVLSLILALIAVFVSLRHTESLERSTERQYKEVQEAREELQHLANRLLELQEEERTRLSRELHDEIGQALATLRLEILRAEPVCAQHLPEIRERLTRARDLAEQTVQSVRTISTLLRPSLLDDLGLEPALDWLVEDFSKRTGIACRLQLQGMVESLPNPVSTCVFRVVQESLHNCEKHSEATSAQVCVKLDNTELVVDISDNGKGFAPAPPGESRRNSRLGLVGMRERAIVQGGTLEVVAAPDQGTRILLRIPLPEQPECSLTMVEAAG